MDGIPQAFIWFSAAHLSRAAVYVIWKVFCQFLFGFVMFMYVRAVHLLLGWYSVGCFDSFTCLLSLGYHQMDLLTLPVYDISSIPIVSYC